MNPTTLIYTTILLLACSYMVSVDNCEVYHLKTILTPVIIYLESSVMNLHQSSAQMGWEWQ